MGLLMVTFGWIVWKNSAPNRALRVVGALLMVQAVFGFFGHRCISARCWLLAAAH